MALELTRQTVELESCIGTRTVQALARAETLLPGAGREAVEILLADARTELTSVEAQEGRVVAEVTLRCQAVYRQGGEASLLALTAQTQLSQAFELPGAEPGMTAQVCATVEHVDARCENGHMVFLTAVSMTARALKLTPVEVVTQIEGDTPMEKRMEELCSCKIPAESTAVAAVRDEQPLSDGLDARCSLMEWGEAWVESCEPDLGGVRIKGRVNAEILLSTGAEGRPAATVRVNPAFDQLVEVPEWLAQDVCAEARLISLESRVEPGREGGEGTLLVEGRVALRVLSLGRDCTVVVTDAYSTGGKSLDVEKQELTVCTETVCSQTQETVRGTLLLNENAPAVNGVICAVAHPNVSGWGVNGETSIEGVIEAAILYAGPDGELASARGEMPFSVKYPGVLDENTVVCVDVQSAEARELMGDRVELKCVLGVSISARRTETRSVLTDAKEGEEVPSRPGFVLYWPAPQDDLWTVGRRYGRPVDEIRHVNGDSETLQTGKPLLLRM